MISRETYGTVGDGGNCWPQMAGMVPDLDDEVLIVLVDILEVHLNPLALFISYRVILFGW